jgi:hypothetical protein
MAEPSIGIPPGIEGVLGSRGMDVPRTPVRGRASAERALCEQAAAIRGGATTEVRLSLSEQAVSPGALIDASGTAVVFPPAVTRAYVGLVDCAPRARWGHEAWWVFIPEQSGEPPTPLKTNLPPHPNGPVRFVAVITPDARP